MRTGLLIVVIAAIVSAMAASCLDEQKIEFDRYYTAGALVYQTHCQNCHGQNGEGLSALIPPLTDSAYLKKNIHQIPCFVFNGMNQVISINQKVYQDKMPPNNLGPVEIARVLTYVGNSFGNKIGLVRVEQVDGDLKVCK